MMKECEEPATDIQFGVAFPEGYAGPSACPGLPTREVALAQGAEPFPEGTCDLSLRLGAAFTDPSSAGRAYDRALGACRALAAGLLSNGRLSALVLEFPETFLYAASERRHLDRVLRDLSGFPLVAAFPDRGWYSSRVIEALKQRDVSLCLPGFRGDGDMPSCIDLATSSLIYVKFRTRWWKGAGLLESWIPRLEALSAQADRLRVLFAGESVETAAEGARLCGELWLRRKMLRDAGRKYP